MPVRPSQQGANERAVAERLAFITRPASRVLVLASSLILAAVVTESCANEAGDDGRSLSHLFGESLAPEPLEVCRASRQMPAEERYEYLLNKVLPADSNRIRLTVDYLPTNPSPPVVEKYGRGEAPAVFQSSSSHKPSGGVLVSPAIELVEVARLSGKLTRLAEAISQRTSADIEQIKSQLAIQILIAWAEEDWSRAARMLARFVAAVRESPDTDPEFQLEMIVLWSSLRDLESLDQVFDLLHLVHGYGVYDQTHDDYSPGNRLFKRQLTWIKSQVDDRLNREALENTSRVVDSNPERWVSVSRRTAETEGMGYPNPHWVKRGASVQKIAPHDRDFLYYSLPLRGDFEIEGDLSTFSYRDVRLSLGNHWIGPVYTLDECEQGTFRRQGENLVLDEPLLEMYELMRVRIAVRDGTRTVYVNGRKISSRPHGPASDPWVAIVSPWYGSSVVQNLRITGSAEIPDEIDLLADSELPGWLSYYVAADYGVTVDNDAESGWRIEAGDSPSDNTLIGQADEALRGSHQERLLRYCRPMLEDGVIEYEFYYEDGKAAVYPALGRCCFLFDRERVGLHWLTDGRYDRTGLLPANFTEVAAIRAESNPLPLVPNDWNRLSLTLQGDTVNIALNGETILTRTLKPENLRTFGLFHYADRTEALVRNLRWSGDWPKTFPEPQQQELADYSLEKELADGPELPVVFEHDFSKGLPANKIWGGGREGWHFHKEERPTGVRIHKRGGWYSHHTLSLPIEVEGDFDIALTYEDFQSTVVPEGEGDVQLEVIFADEFETDFRLYRKHHHRKSGKHEQIVEVGLFQQMENNEHRDWPNHYTEESNAGTMRVVRRGDQLFLLHSTAGSPHFRLVHRRQVTTAPIRFGGVKAIVETHRDSEVSVLWKRITVRAQAPTNFTVRDAMTVGQLDQQRSELAQSEFVTFDQRTPETQFWIWGNADILKQSGGWQFKQPGTEEWKWCGFNWRGGIKGDYDLTLELEVVKMEEPDGDHETYFLLKNRRASSFFQGAEFKISSTRHGKRELIVQQNTSRRNGSNRYEKIKIQPVKTVTHLRFARRGDVLYFLYRSEGDTKDRIVGYTVAGADDLPPTSLLTMCRTGGKGKETIVKVKSMDVRADGMIHPAPEP